ncbi:MAG: hypothetical protein C4586_02195 [Anaerolineaceae bacterium]|nr:MAG: hypothetical protein C4586_02195 [Anaerolineaceae bacterium]
MHYFSNFDFHNPAPARFDKKTNPGIYTLAQIDHKFPVPPKDSIEAGISSLFICLVYNGQKIFNISDIRRGMFCMYWKI